MRKIIGFFRKFLGLEYYVSPLDQFLTAYDSTHPKQSLSQRKEIKKYDRIFFLRTHKIRQETAKLKLWENF